MQGQAELNEKLHTILQVNKAGLENRRDRRDVSIEGCSLSSVVAFSCRHSSACMSSSDEGINVLQTLKGPACASFAWPFLQAPALRARYSIWPSLAHLNYPWLQRVRKADAEDYFDIITKPMDFAAMTKKLKKNEYFSKATTTCSRALAECWCAGCIRRGSGPHRAQLPQI